MTTKQYRVSSLAVYNQPVVLGFNKMYLSTPSFFEDFNNLSSFTFEHLNFSYVPI